MLKDRPGGFYALDAKTGTLKWRHKAKGGIRTSPVVSDGMVYFIDGHPSHREGALWALDAKTGQLKWFKTGWSLKRVNVPGQGIRDLGVAPCQ